MLAIRRDDQLSSIQERSGLWHIHDFHSSLIHDSPIQARSGIWKRQTKADRPSRDSKNDRKDRKAAL